MSPAGVVHHYYHKLWALPFICVSTVLAGSGAIYLAETSRISLASYVLEFWLWANFWYISGRIIDPDLDLIGVSAAEGRALREGGIFGVFFFGYSSFYSALMYYLSKKLHIRGIAGAHRSWLTHSPIGTLIRICFINAPLAYLYQVSGLIFNFFHVNIRLADIDILIFFAAQFVGLGIADAIHVYLDNHYGEGVKTIR